MRGGLILILALTIGPPTAAQEGAVVEACKSAIALDALVSDVDADVVQDFTGMGSPKVRLAVQGFTRSEFECEFDSIAPPMTLTRFCGEFGCAPLTPDLEMRAKLQELGMDQASRLTLEELNFLLDQDGY